MTHSAHIIYIQPSENHCEWRTRHERIILSTSGQFSINNIYPVRTSTGHASTNPSQALLPLFTALLHTHTPHTSHFVLRIAWWTRSKMGDLGVLYVIHCTQHPAFFRWIHLGMCRHVRDIAARRAAVWWIMKSALPRGGHCCARRVQLPCTRLDVSRMVVNKAVPVACACIRSRRVT